MLVVVPAVLTSLPAFAGVITTDTVWKGEVAVTEDILVPEGVTLTILPGTILKIAASDSTKTDPEYLSPLTEITVRGTLRADGTAAAPIFFSMAGEEKSQGWAGIIVDGGAVSLRACRIQDAETGVYVVKGAVSIKNSALQKNRYGIAAQGPDASIRIEDTMVDENEYGIFSFKGATIVRKNSTVRQNRKKDVYAASMKDAVSAPKVYRAETKDTARIYGDAVLLGDTVWQGLIEINGIIRVPAEGRLLIMPGTVVAFRKKDTNDDGIGENGILIQGVLVAKGTREQPVLFRSAERHRARGDWDAVNIMNSDGAQNLIEFCQIEDAYRGLHFHFSNVAIHGSVIRNNYRGIQFQESNVEMTGNYLYENKSGLQARDSEIIFTDNFLAHNYYGASFFRVNLTASGNTIVNNAREGLRIREGIPVVEENLIDGNRYGLMVSEARYGRFHRNVITHNIETGISFKGADNIEVTGNFIHANGFNGLNIQDSGAVIKGNNISDNGERGIGVLSFAGTITENNIVKNGLYAIDLESEADISAPLNWWGAGEVRQALHDKERDPAKGRIHYSPVKQEPIIFSWPSTTIVSDVTWHGSIALASGLTVQSGSTLTLSPPATVIFSPGVDLRINGRIIARGDKNGRITFTSLQKDGASDWGEIFLEHADGSDFAGCNIEYATWGIHSHFTHLRIEDCRFRKNYGGIRFRGGPLEVLHSLFEGNTIGLRAYRGTALIVENNFTGNDVGIFVREKGGALTIKRNNLYANSGYNIRLGDFNEDDVTAQENYWGDGDPAETIMDGRKEHGIGTVHYEPYGKKPYLHKRKGSM